MQARLPKYTKPLFTPQRYKVIYGGRGAARSWSVARALLIAAAQKKTRILCCRELQRSIQDSVHRLLSDQINLLNIPGYEVTQREIRHANGSLFIFEGLRHNITKIKSIEGIDVAWVEEAESVSEDSWQILIPTIRKAGSEIWITFNPDLESDPTYRRFVLNPPDDCWTIKVSADDNPWLPDELKREREYLYRVDPDAAAHVWGGECRQHTDSQILRGKWIVESFEPEQWDGPYHGADWGFSQDPTVLVKCWINDRKLYIEHEAYKIGLELSDTANYWKAHVPDCEKYIIRADSARPESISHVKRNGIPMIQSVEKWKGSVEDGIAHLRSYEEIIIHPRCKRTVDEARHYSYKVDQRTGDVLPVIVDSNNHCIDAIRYALAPIIRKSGFIFE